MKIMKWNRLFLLSYPLESGVQFKDCYEITVMLVGGTAHVVLGTPCGGNEVFADLSCAG